MRAQVSSDEPQELAHLHVRFSGREVLLPRFLERDQTLAVDVLSYGVDTAGL